MGSGFRKPPGAALVRAVLLAGIAGNVVISLYLSFAFPVFFGRSPLLLFQWDDSNMVGSVAFAGGWGSALARSPVPSGLLFGMAVMLAMFYVVVPLGHAQHPSSDPRSLLNALVAHTVFFGISVALVVAGICRRTVAGRHEGIRTPAN